MSTTKDTLKQLEARVADLETRLSSLTVSNKKKSGSDSEEKPKREFKPSAARDAWRALCDAVRAVHKKNAMKIAKILKDKGHMTPNEKQIEEAIQQFDEMKDEGGNSAASQSATDVDVDMTSASEADEHVEEEKPAPQPEKKGGRKRK